MSIPPNKDAYHLLIVDDDLKIRNLLQKYLIENGYFVSTAKNTVEALKIIQEIECHLIILDIMMPEENGVEFTRKLRKDLYQKIPIILLTAMGEMDDKIIGLESGADDYIVKPFEPKELLLRIYNILKRMQENAREVLFREYTYNRANKILKRDNQQIFLTQGETSLLHLLLCSYNKILSREFLAKELNINERSVDVQIIRLRNKIEKTPSRPEFLQTVRNQGYIFKI